MSSPIASSVANEQFGDIQAQLRSLRNSVDHLEAVASVPAKQRNTSVKEIASDIASDAYNVGIPTDILEQLVDVLTKPNHLDQPTITTLVKNLYPLERVPSIVVTKAVCSLGPTKLKPSLATQTLLLQWLLLVYEFLEEPAILFKLYSVLFNLLDMISLRRPLCHILSLITRRPHVKPFRIQAIMELLRNAGDDEKELMGLLRVFKNYYPDIIVGEIGRSKFFFKHPDPEWTAKLRQLQERNLERIQFGNGHNVFQVVRRGVSKRRKVSGIIPDLQTSRVKPNFTSLEELRDVDNFVESLEKIELPNQIVSMLENRMAHKYMAFVLPEIARDRLEDWLDAFLKDEIELAKLPDSADSEAIRYVLGAVCGYVQSTKQLPNAVQTFLNNYLQTWNGRDYRQEIFGILQFIPKGSYDDIRSQYLERLDTTVLDHTASSRTDLLDFYANLIRRWGISLRTQDSSFTSGNLRLLVSLITHVEFLLLSLMEVPFTTEARNVGDSKPVIMSILDLYSNLAELYSHASTNGNIRLTVPLPPVIYSLTFTSNLAQISRLCSILATYKNSFETSLTSQTLRSPDKSTGEFYPPEMIGLYNGYIMDLCNLVWRNRALNREDQNAHGCLVPELAKDAFVEYINDSNEILKHRRRPEGPAFNHSLGLMFSLSHHVALANHSAACFAVLEEQSTETGREEFRLRKPVTQNALKTLEKEGGLKLTWQEYRVKMLEWFDSMGSDGIGKLMRSTMKEFRKDD
ncbi:Mis6 domain protein [Talaromyces stipitatus ATCC 10500]|uniref:Mis6 domain protein n=1 Tax=Talaromyces stipitatus (strain ATCC 10500 / CBS 375.48 / QM 6759 / NRRL 1006) TaxID=441959 RepID=B8M6C5_TALSN|nr:Mis6 domain protein [Talaromyces stipitatus ATCC 10500]EED19300.1 Mis6 domain protein [Talaromyces stipitatus ATCC 10500]